jgi:hypothetical protein
LKISAVAIIVGIGWIIVGKVLDQFLPPGLTGVPFLALLIIALAIAAKIRTTESLKGKAIGYACLAGTYIWTLYSVYFLFPRPFGMYEGIWLLMNMAIGLFVGWFGVSALLLSGRHHRYGK